MPRTAKTLDRYFLGVKWSQVQILSARPLSARPEFMQLRGGFGGSGTACLALRGASYPNAYPNHT